MEGARIGITAHRRAVEQARLVTSLGGVPVLGRSLEADVPRRPATLAEELRAVLAEPLDVAVCLTGVGARRLSAAAAASGPEALLRSRLRLAHVIARGPKPRRELRALRQRVDWTADPASTLLVRDRLLLGAQPGMRVLVQAFAEPPDVLTEPLAERGAACHVLNPYVLGWPQDQTPARRLARETADGSVDALTFTTARAGQQFLAIAETAGVDVADLQGGGALIAAVGPVTRAALEAEGLRVHIVADPPKMGTMYRALAAALAAGSSGWSPPEPAAEAAAEPARG